MQPKIRLPVLCLTCIVLSMPAGYAASLVECPVMLKLRQDLHAITTSPDLDTEHKINAIAAFLDTTPGPHWYLVIDHMQRLDSRIAIDICLSRFRNPESSRNQKLYLGRHLYNTLRRDGNDSGYAENIIAEYRAFIIDAVINGGAEEFNQPNRRDTLTAVGEYIRIISDPQFRSSELHIDERVIQVLIQCLSASDHVYIESDLHPPNIRPGEIRAIGDPSGRNRQRERIPLILAKIKAISAIPALTGIVDDHHDSYLQKNAKTALEILNKLVDAG